MSEQTERPKTLVVTFEEVADITGANELHRRLLEALTKGVPVELRARRCERMDTAILQTLYAFFRAAGERDLPVTWQGVSPGVVDAAQRLGLAGALGLET